MPTLKMILKITVSDLDEAKDAGDEIQEFINELDQPISCEINYLGTMIKTE